MNVKKHQKTAVKRYFCTLIGEKYVVFFDKVGFIVVFTIYRQDQKVKKNDNEIGKFSKSPNTLRKCN